MSKLTKKHFILLAEVVTMITNPVERRTVMREIMNICRESNPMFNPDKFRQACGVE